jgi:hypothetical protein
MSDCVLVTELSRLSFPVFSPRNYVSTAIISRPASPLNLKNQRQVKGRGVANVINLSIHKKGNAS